MTLGQDDDCLRLRDDSERIGHAILTLPFAREEPPALALRFADATFLEADGRRSRGRHFFATEAVGLPPCRSFRLGPEITAYVREAERVDFVENDGRVLGTLIWEDIRVPPASGSSARLGPGGATARKGASGAAPSLAARHAGVATASPSSMIAAAEPPQLPPKKPARRIARRAAILVGACALVAPLALTVAVLAGLAGWRLEPASVLFSRSAEGALSPALLQVKLVTAWYARPLLSAPFLHPPILSPKNVPAWLELRAAFQNDAWIVSPTKFASTLAAGRYEVRLPLVFPLREVEALVVSLKVAPASPPMAPPKSAETPVSLSSFDEAACDRAAGNRFDGDHPSGAGYRDEIFDLPESEIEQGLAACDAGLAHTGAGRRFGVQRGRLLAHRALLRLAAGDAAAASADMTAAVALWHRGDEQGSAYAANLLGAFHDGIFNRPGHSFVTADERLADAYWKRAMDAGNAVAERNYAAQLLAGKGIPANPAKAVVLLRDAIGKGDLHATAILGVALVTGSPPGVTVDSTEGWRLVVAAQCVDKGAAALLDQKIASGEQPATGRHACR